MYRNFLFFGVLILFFISCKQPSALSKTFSCANASTPNNLEVVAEYQNRFSIKLPKTWKTELYNLSNQSGIISADTTKLLSNSYKIDFGIISGNIDLSSELNKQVEAIMKANDFTTVKYKFLPYKGYDSYAHLAKGKQMDKTFNLFQYYIKLEKEKYILVKCEFYGDEDFDTRFCEALALIDTIELKENNNEY